MKKSIGIAEEYYNDKLFTKQNVDKNFIVISKRQYDYKQSIDINELSRLLPSLH